MSKVTLRLPDDLDAKLKEEWQHTFPEHGWSFNRWMVALLTGALEAEPLLDSLS